MKCNGRQEETKLKMKKTGLKELFFLQHLGSKTETDFQRREKYRGFILEMGSPGTQCLLCDLVIDTRFVDEAYILHQPTACGCCIR